VSDQRSVADADRVQERMQRAGEEAERVMGGRLARATEAWQIDGVDGRARRE